MTTNTPDHAPTLHEHRLGPFRAEADPSEHDDLIATAAGTVWGHPCEQCLADAVARLSASGAAMARLLELLARAYDDGTDVPYGSDGRSRFRSTYPGWDDLAYLIEQSPMDRRAVIDRLDSGFRSGIAQAAVRTLTGQWALDYFRTEQEAKDAAWRARFAGAETRWGWAVFRETETASTDGVYAYGRRCAVHVAATAELDDADYLLEPVDVASGETSGAGGILHEHGWGLAWGWETVPLDPGPLGTNATRLSRCWIGRVRYPAIDPRGRERVPYAEDARWPLETDRHYPYNDVTVYGPPPGRVRYALGSVAGAETGDDEATAPARETIATYRQWLHDALVAHGWPQAGVDAGGLARAVLAWVASDPDPARRRACTEPLAADVEAGLADPAHLETLSGSQVLSAAEVYEVVCREYVE